MDIPTAALLGGVLLIAFVVALRYLAIMDRNSQQQLEMARERAERVAIMNGYNPKKTGKKPKKKAGGQVDDDPEPDDLDALLDATEPYKAFIKGVVQKRGLPVDVDALYDGDELEREKVGAYLERELKKAGSGDTGDGVVMVSGPYL